MFRKILGEASQILQQNSAELEKERQEAAGALGPGGEIFWAFQFLEPICPHNLFKDTVEDVN